MDKNQRNADKLIELEGFFLNPRNEIVKPDRYVASSKYFWDKWVPELGPNLTVIIMQLRKHCFYNRSTGEKRDSVHMSLDQLAVECGFSWRTICRELQSSVAQKFLKISPNYKYDESLQKKVRAPNTYRVVLDDPIHPSDQDKFLQMKEKRNSIATAESIANDLTAKLAVRSKKPTENPGPNCQIGNHIYDCQIGSHIMNKNTFKNTLNVNVHEKQKKNETIQKPVIKQNDSITYREEALVEKILSVTKDPKSEGFYRQVAVHCSQANVENAIEDIKTYAASGRKIKNPGALFTSRIKNLDQYFRRPNPSRG